MKNFFTSHNAPMETVLPTLPDNSVDIILMDPPYLYLKNQKLDKEFDEELLFTHARRLLKDKGFIVMFGRGTSFYRWNTMLDDLGFVFKEEIVWNKIQNTSPLLAMGRVHETVSIFTKKNGTINRVKVPYLEMKGHDLGSIITDVKRLKTTFKNTKSLNAVLEFLENNNIDSDEIVRTDMMDKTQKFRVAESDKVKDYDRCVNVMQAVNFGLNEKSIIRTDYNKDTGHGISGASKIQHDRCVTVMQGVEFGLNEKSIIKQVRNHYKAIHPTEKPVRLLERLIALVRPKDIETPVVLDPFAGSFSTGLAAINSGCYPILIELDKEYYQGGNERITNYINESQQ